MNVSTGLRMRIEINGVVQGANFRPFVRRLATRLALQGWVSNSAEGVIIEAEGTPEHLEEFLTRLQDDRPPLSDIHSVQHTSMDRAGYEDFIIRPGDNSSDRSVLVLPDIATCPECLAEMWDPANRRYRYPFIACTHCGPRYSIMEALPYDRHHTTMRRFRLCETCQFEYENPADRRFQAHPTGCPHCGPHLELWDHIGAVLALFDDVVAQAADAVGDGAIVAVKGIGGFHFVVDARNEKAVQRLRTRKHRAEKPFALMYPSLDYIKTQCEVAPLEEQLLNSPEAPVVLLRRLAFPTTPAVAPSVAPRNPFLGAMLPYSPLHHLLMAELNFPIVVTSGNLSDEPICIDEYEAIDRLGGIADLFLVHDRPITRPLDDSVVRLIGGREALIRRSRGYAPQPVKVQEDLPALLASGAEIKNTVAVSSARHIFVSQHNGDMTTTLTFEASLQAMSTLKRLYDVQPQAIACDLHPNYISTKSAEATATPVIHVQHHYAHILSCMADNGIKPPVLGIAWDGAGYGIDGTLWGGEFLHVPDHSFSRVAHLRQFSLPGGDKAIREPRRAAIGLLYEIFGNELFTARHLNPVRTFTPGELAVLQRMLREKLNTPITSSAGRLFDAVGSLVNLRHHISFEGQAAMELEFIINDVNTDEVYPFDLVSEPGDNPQAPMVIDWAETIFGMINDLSDNVTPSEIAAKFHNTLAEIIVQTALRIGEPKVVLSGGCFQNKYLTERAIARLQAAGFQPYWHRRIPTNDGGIALGQIIAASHELAADGAARTGKA